MRQLTYNRQPWVRPAWLRNATMCGVALVTGGCMQSSAVSGNSDSDDIQAQLAELMADGALSPEMSADDSGFEALPDRVCQPGSDNPFPGFPFPGFPFFGPVPQSPTVGIVGIATGGTLAGGFESDSGVDFPAQRTAGNIMGTGGAPAGGFEIPGTGGFEVTGGTEFPEEPPPGGTMGSGGFEIPGAGGIPAGGFEIPGTGGIPTGGIPTGGFEIPGPGGIEATGGTIFPEPPSTGGIMASGGFEIPGPGGIEATGGTIFPEPPSAGGIMGSGGFEFPFPGDGQEGSIEACSTQPIGYWRFDDCNGERTDLLDSSGHDHRAYRNIRQACVASQEGLAAEFSHKNDLVYAPDQPSFVLDHGVTVAAWVKPNRVNGVRTLVRKRDGRKSAFAMLIRNGKYQFIVRLASGKFASVKAPATVNQWAHVAGTYDGYELKLYIDGYQVAQRVVPGTLAAGPGPLLVGNDMSKRRFDGLIDDIWFNTMAAPDDKILELTCIRQPLALSVSPEVGPEVEAGTGVIFEVTATNNNSPACGLEQAVLLTNVPSDLNTSESFRGLSPIGPGESVTAPIEIFSNEEVEPGTHTINFALLDLQSFSQTSSVDALYTVSAPNGCFVSSRKELTIRDVSVVDDPTRTGANGAWSFGRLMERLSPSASQAPDVTEAMFRSFITPQTINSFVASPRPEMEPRVLAPWPRDGSGNLDLSRAPLRLLAIVNRLDLKDLANGKAGEGRFVYGVLDPSGFQMEFTVILEYALPAETEDAFVAWADAFHALHDLPFPSEEYNAALQAITDRFTAQDAWPGAPNDSALIDIRTNEIALSGDWQFREFRLSESTGFLDPSPLFQTPDISFNNTETLARFINENEADILDETHEAPLTFEGAPFNTGAVPNFIDFWSAPGINNPEARHKFSLNTCNGCHGGETNTFFLQITPRNVGQESQLAGFQTGITVTDIATGQPRRLAELHRRRLLMESAVCRPESTP